MRAGQNLSLDFMLKNNIKAIAKQNDVNSRFFNIALKINRQVVTPSNTAIATFNIERSDGQKNSYIAVIEDGIVKIFLSDWAVEIEGILKCDVSIIEDNERLTTMPFSVEIVKACCTTGDIIDIDTEDILTNLYNLLQQYEGYDLEGIKNKVEELEIIIDGLENSVAYENIEIQPNLWVYNDLNNKYEYTVENDFITQNTYILANELSNVLVYADIQSNDGSYKITASEKPAEAVILLLILYKGE